MTKAILRKTQSGQKLTRQEIVNEGLLMYELKVCKMLRDALERFLKEQENPTNLVTLRFWEHKVNDYVAILNECEKKRLVHGGQTQSGLK